MKFDLSSAPEAIRNNKWGIEIGNVCRNQRNQYYVIISVFETKRTEEEKATALVVDEEGNISGSQCYICYYFSRLKLVGKVLNLPDILEIEWLD